VYEMLPKLKSGAGTKITGIADPGWVLRDLSELQKLAESLDVPQKALGRTVIDAVPDMWARVMVFAFALLETEHQLHRTSVNSLRGFLTLLALRERKGLTVKAVPLELSASNRNLFLDTVTRLLPKNGEGADRAGIGALSDDLDWTGLSVFTLEQSTIGVTSPLTLICPAEGVHLRALNALPTWWFDGFRLVDPTDGLSLAERRDVAAWIRDLASTVSNHPSPYASGSWRTRLATILDEFAADLAKGDSEFNHAAHAPKLSMLTLGLGGRSIYAGLNFPLEPVPEDIAESMVCLQPERTGKFADGLKKLLIIHPDVDKQWSMDPAQIVVTGGRTHAEVKLLPLGSDKTKLGRIPLKAGIEWRRPEQVFTDQILILKDSQKACPGAVEIKGQESVATKFDGTPLIPIRPEILSYLTPQYIQKHSSFQVVEGGIEFSLDLPMQHGRKLSVTRKFSGEKKEIIQERSWKLPVIEIWPGFNSKIWKAYFVLWDSIGETTFQATPLVPGLSGELYEEAGASGRGGRKVTELSAAPEYLVCTTPDGKDVGCILPTLQPAPAVDNLTFRIGVDFGTTNTNVYLRKEGDLPYPLELRSGSHAVTAVTQANREASLFMQFLPPVGETLGKETFQKPPFLSFFRSRITGDADLAPVRQGHILFYHSGHNHDYIGDPKTSTNLKWEGRERVRLRAFLRQICLHAAAEALRQGAGKLVYNYSLPSAFPKFLEDEFDNTWTAVVNWIGTASGIPCEPPTRETESVVAAKYFSSRGQANPAWGSVVIDIGGGTSDIAIWQDNNLLLQTSIQFSGRQILLEPLFRLRSTVISEFSVGSPSRREELQSTLEPQKFYSRLDAFLRNNSEELQEWISVSSSHESLSRFLDCVKLGLSGLFYYTGLMFRHLIETGRYQQRMPKVYIAGNGVRLFDWVAGGYFGPKKQVNELFKTMFQHASGIEGSIDDLEIALSDNPKAEAAYGLVADSRLKVGRTDAEAFSQLVAGEPFLESGKTVGATGLLTREILAQGVSVPDLPMLGDFIDLYNGFVKKRDWKLNEIKDRNRVLQSARQHVFKWAKEMSGSLAKDIPLEPVFVIALIQMLRDFLEE
jgi:hypothetical protein